MKRAFTLIELLVVVGIMAFLGVAATGGYAALQRGMAERGATQVASSILAAAKERAHVDRSPTMVFCYNRLVRKADDDNNGIVVGEAVAVRRAGRITRVQGGGQGQKLFDEFADFFGAYDVMDNESDIKNRKGMKLWRFDDQKMNSMAYSVVADAVLWEDLNGVTYDDWTGVEEESEWKGFGVYKNDDFRLYACAFYNLGTSDHEPSTWVIGSGYGFEFARVQLPQNFIFKTDVPNDVGQVVEADSFYFDPELDVDETIEISFCMPDNSGNPKRHHKAGVATSEK